MYQGITREDPIEALRSDMSSNLNDNLLIQAQKAIEVSKTLNLRDLNWIPPFFILMITAAANRKSDTDTIELPSNQNFKSYLSTINFPEGYRQGTLPSNTTYLPIVRISAKNKESQIIGRISEILARFLGAHSGILDGVSFGLTEMINNVFEHSQAREAWILAQWYPNKKFIDLCIVDTGITILGAYKKYSFAINNDIEAISSAVRGKSTKPEKTRGFGLGPTSRIVTELFDGTFMIVSGFAAFQRNGKSAKLYQLREPWQGTAIAMRMYAQPKSIPIYKILS